MEDFLLAFLKAGFLNCVYTNIQSLSESIEKLINNEYTSECVSESDNNVVVTFTNIKTTTDITLKFTFRDGISYPKIIENIFVIK